MALTDFEVRVATGEDDIRRCWPVFAELRENIPTEAEFLRRWRAQVDEGYTVVYIERDGAVVAVGGYRLLHNLAWGRVVYLDDLAALRSEHGQGLGASILRYVQDEARRLGCEAVHLDTGYHRQRAHRTYLRNGFDLTAHHLAWRIPPS